jgi:acyl dehydratase
MSGPVITDEMRAKARTWQGDPYNGGEVHREDIRKFATAVGDNNPLWLDADYAGATRWGGIIAPPTFVDRFTPFYVLGDDNSQGYLGGPMPAQASFRHLVSGGDEHVVHRPVRPGDIITATTTIGDMFEKRGRPGVGQMLFVRYDKTYRDQRGEVVSVCRWTSVEYEGPADGEEEPAVVPRLPHPPDGSRLPSNPGREELWARPVYFEDVVDGFEPPPVSMLQTTKRFVRYAQASNDLTEIHYDYRLMRERGMPDVIGQGALSAAYIASMLSDWYTPDGLLKRISVQYRYFSFPGDVVTARGIVTGKHREGGEGLVDLDVWAENQDGGKLTVGQAVVSLPSREVPGK